jgi:protein-tyrosine-phosphatase
MKIIFVCRHNRFRSKVGECIFNSFNKNKRIIAESAGIIIDRNPVCLNVLNLMKEKRYEIKDVIPRQITSAEVNNYNKIIIVANNIEPNFFKNSFNGEILWWKVSDCDEKDIEGIKKRIDEIEEKVRRFMKESQ